MPTAHILHGFNISDGGRGSIDKIIPFLKDKGFDIHEHDYGWRGLLGVRLFNASTAHDVAKSVRPGDICIGHSNGCAILYLASFECNPAGMVFINPALDSDVQPECNWVHVYFNKDDPIVEISKYLIFHAWGNMGQVGYIGHKDYITNIDTQDYINMPCVSGHSDFFNHDSWMEQMSVYTKAAWDKQDNRHV